MTNVPISTHPPHSTDNPPVIIRCLGLLPDRRGFTLLPVKDLVNTLERRLEGSIRSIHVTPAALTISFASAATAALAITVYSGGSLEFVRDQCPAGPVLRADPGAHFPSRGSPSQSPALPTPPRHLLLSVQYAGLNFQLPGDSRSSFELTTDR